MDSSKEICPYLGLEPYTEANRAFFFGRERDQRVIISNLYAASLTILYGASGVGKSSVILAGVVPDLLAEPSTLVIVFREWHDPSFQINLKSECIRATEAALKKQISIDVNLPFDDLLFEINHIIKGTVFVLFDQFEEYFSYHTDIKIANWFETEFARAINRKDINAGFLIVLRDDGLYKMDRFRTRIPNLLENTLRLKHLDISAAEDAIRKPLNKYNEIVGSSNNNFLIEDKLVKEVLEQVRIGRVSIRQTGRIINENNNDLTEKETDRIETAFLQLVMTRLWNEEVLEKSNTLRLDTLNKLGGAEKIIRTHLDIVLNEFDNNKKELCSILFDRLVTPSGTKIALQENDLKRYAGRLAQEVPNVLEVLIKKRILRCIPAPLDQPQTLRYEIFHDLLALAILDWQTRFIQGQMTAEVRRVKRKAVAATKNYNNLRVSIGFLILFFPIILVLGTLLSGGIRIQNSISAYYHTNMRDFFVGALTAIAVLFQSYSGYTKIDKITSNLACIFLIGLAFFPIVNNNMAATKDTLSSILHIACLSLFFITQIFFFLFLFTKSAKYQTIAKRKRNNVYRICGYTITLSLILIVIINSLPFRMLYEYSVSFWLECLSFNSVGIAWLIKGKAILKEKDEF